jgi:catechol 2,3-dioxygenase-like lactoylglutathione lyase family enzyme
VIGIPDSRTEIVMLRPPDGGTRLELSSFVRPDHHPGSPTAMANELGLRNVAFEVDDLPAAVDRLAADGYELVGDVASTSTSGAWLTSVVRKESSCRWPNVSADLPSPAPALWRFPDTDIAEEPIELLDGIVAATGRPALTAYLIDGDQLDIAGFSWQHGLWRALAPPSAPLDARLVAHFEDEPPPLDRLEPDKAAAAALRWAAAAVPATAQHCISCSLRSTRTSSVASAQLVIRLCEFCWSTEHALQLACRNRFAPIDE